MRLQVAVVVLVAASLAACSEEITPVDGTEAWGSDNCVHTYTNERGWEKTLNCRSQRADGTWQLTFVGVNIGVVDERDPEVTVYTDAVTGITHAWLNSDHTPVVRTHLGWISLEAYLATLSAAEQRSETPPPEAQASTMAGYTWAELRTRWTEVQVRVANRIFAPDCVGSYNGC